MALTFHIALMVMLLQQVAVVGQVLVFLRLVQHVCPRGWTAAVLGQRPVRGHSNKKEPLFDGKLRLGKGHLSIVKQKIIFK